jgi:hypothetical protein
MFSILPLAISIMFSAQIEYVDGFGGLGGNFGGLTQFNYAVSQWAQQRDLQIADRRRLLDEANHFTDADINRIFSEKGSDLRSIKAILTRYRDDFSQVRDRNDQDGDLTKAKVREIFKTELYQYYPNSRDLRPLLDHLIRDQHDTSTNKEHKILYLLDKITNIKKSLIYMRDLSIKRGVTPFQVFVYLYHVDIQLAIHKYHCQTSRDTDSCKDYHRLLRELDV